MNLYEVLGLDKTATPEEIKKAYKKLAKMHHPDAGGDEEMFKKINEAYAILSDAPQKEIYDLTGKFSKKISIKDHVKNYMLKIIVPELEKNNLAGHPDLMSFILEVLNGTIEYGEQAKAGALKIANNFESTISHLKFKGDSEDVMNDIFKAKVEQWKEKVSGIESELLTMKQVVEYIKENYELNPSVKRRNQEQISTMIDKLKIKFA